MFSASKAAKTQNDVRVAPFFSGFGNWVLCKYVTSSSSRPSSATTTSSAASRAKLSFTKVLRKCYSNDIHHCGKYVIANLRPSCPLRNQYFGGFCPCFLLQLLRNKSSASLDFKRPLKWPGFLNHHIHLVQSCALRRLSLS